MKTEIIEISREEEKRRISLQLVITGTLENKESGMICVQAPRYAKPFTRMEVCVDNLEKEERIKADFQYQFQLGGRYVFYTWVKGNELATLNRIVVSFRGAGMFSGNVHSHSTYSDGKSSLTENRAAMMENGHSFLYATDHNTTAHFAELEAYCAKGVEENFLHIPGWEYTTNFGHSIAYRTDHVYDPDKIAERGDLDAWQEYVDAMNVEGGIVYLAHPYEAPKYEFGEAVLRDIEGIVGVEAWNGYNYHALSYQNRRNFEVWDKLNRRGGCHYFATAVSDAHTRDGQSSPYIKGYLSKLDRAAVEGMLCMGNFFGSNGPELEFRIGETRMGGTYFTEYDRAGRTRKALMMIDAFDPIGRIEAVNVYRGFVDGKYLERPNTVKVFEFYPMGELESSNFVKNLLIDVKPGEFYRVEMITEIGVVAYLSNPGRIEKGFAFTNPIWIEG